MSFRTRVALVLAVAALVPLAALAFVVRSRVTERLTAAYQQRVAALASGIEQELARRETSIASRLASVADAMGDDNRVRLALAQRTRGERGYLLDYGERAMRLTGLSMFQVQDERGRILTSGHFRNEYDRLEPDLPRVLAEPPGGLMLARARAPDGPFLALVRVDSVRLGGELLHLVGGEALDARDVERWQAGGELRVALVTPDTTFGAVDAGAPAAVAAVVRTIPLRYVAVDGAAASAPAAAQIVVTHPLTALAALRASIDRWVLLTATGAAALALLLAVWLAARVTRPITALADKTASLDLDRLDADFRSDRTDEIGDLSRLLGAMTARLRASARKLREAERRAVTGELARQVNHDIKNGLVPIRNVMRHLASVRSTPDELARVLAEREGTVESSLTYLETLAQSYARLSPRAEAQACDVGAVVLDVVHHARGAPGAVVEADVRAPLPMVMADPVALRRILENLVGNAVDSLDGRAGRVAVTAERLDGAERRGAAAGAAGAVRLIVQDSGRGMTREELARAFDDFYTTKEGGTGLGLSVVRRLVMDLHGVMRVDTKPGEGTRFVIELPAWPPRPIAPPRAGP